MVELSTNMSLRTGTSDQILLDWSSNALPSGTRDQCGDYGTYPAVPGTPSGNGCGFQMASLRFNVINTGGGEAAFTLSNSSPGAGARKRASGDDGASGHEQRRWK